MAHNDFINRHTAFAVLLLVLGCFFAGYFVGQMSERSKYAPIPTDCPPGEICY